MLCLCVVTCLIVSSYWVAVPDDFIYGVNELDIVFVFFFVENPTLFTDTVPLAMLLGLFETFFIFSEDN